MIQTIDTTGLTMAEVAQRLPFGSGPLVLDVRTRAEFLRGHVPGALNAPLSDIERSPRSIAQALDGYDQVLVHCSSGERSRCAVELLRESGAGKLVLVESSGFSDWKELGYPVEVGPGRKAHVSDPRPWLRALKTGVGVGVIATLASGVMDSGLSLLVSQRQKRREQRVRRGSPHRVAGRVFFERIRGRSPSRIENLMASLAFSFAYSAMWGIAYAALRRVQPLSRKAPAVPVTATAFFLACDGLIAPLLDLTPEVNQLPWQFNVKELANHITWNATAERLHRADERKFTLEQLGRG